MAKTKISEYDSNPANNTDIDSINLSEGVMVPSDLNNSLRMQMAHLKDFSDGTSGIDVLNLQDDDASASIKIQAPSAVTTTTTFTLPDGDGSTGQVLDTNGSGTLAWTKVQASNLDVAGNGTSGQALTSDGDGSFSWTTIASYPQVITIQTSGNYSIPSGAVAVMIKASGGGGGGSGTGGGSDGYIGAGGNGGDTTVVNATLGINITAKGGRGGSGGAGDAALTGSSGGDILYKAGAGGGEAGEHGSNNDWRFGGQDGHPGSLVLKYVTGASVGGETLTISYGSGGTAGVGGGSYGKNDGAAGQAGYVEIWVW